jgi:hypothetical protein
MPSETYLLRNQAFQNQRNSFSRGFPLPFNVETLQALGALFQIPLTVSLAAVKITVSGSSL